MKQQDLYNPKPRKSVPSDSLLPHAPFATLLRLYVKPLFREFMHNFLNKKAIKN